jgi:dTDP-4-dehydrorhamnose 3,5-epimerase
VSGFREGEIEGIEVKLLRHHRDQRGWLAELFREDEIDKEVCPVMAYISMTFPGVERGPHEHREQTDYFVFFSSSFKLVLWDTREGSPTYMNRKALFLGEENPACVIVPPGIVHAYRNVGDADGMVMNLPNRLFAGRGKGEPVDEVRYEGDPDTPYKVDG